MPAYIGIGIGMPFGPAIMYPGGGRGGAWSEETEFFLLDFDFDFAGEDDPKRLLLFFFPFVLDKLTELLFRLLDFPLVALTGVAGGEAICRGGGCTGAGCWTPLLRSNASISPTDKLIFV